MKRVSPIYPLPGASNEINPLADGNGHILFLFTTDAFYLIALVQQIAQREGWQVIICVSHGLASVLVFSGTGDEFSSIVRQCKQNLAAYEEWHVQEWKLVLNKPVFVRQPTDSWAIDIPTKHLDRDDQVFVIDITLLLEDAYKAADSLAPEYMEFLDNVMLDIRAVVLSLLYLQDRLTDAEFIASLESAIHSDTERERLRSELKRMKANPDEKLVRIHQLKDEIVQVTAILRSLNSQAFSGLPPLLRSPFDHGQNSLLGIGGCFATLLALYMSVRKAFSRVIVDKVVSEKFPEMPCPSLQDNPADYEEWLRRVRGGQYIGVDSRQSGDDITDLAAHLVYFSNRLGFRETKHSISAAYQTLFFAHLPEWSLCTITHEYLHAHVRAMLASIYPVVDGRLGDFDVCYELLRTHITKKESPSNLHDFLRVFLLDLVQKLSYIRTNQVENERICIKMLPKRKLAEALRGFSNDFNEHVVHVLDFHYFYDADPDVYIKAIWASWLTLPFIISRIPEYLMRTISAISSVASGACSQRFEWCLRKVKAQIEELRKLPLVEEEKVDLVVKVLDSKDVQRQMSTEFHEVWAPLVDTTVTFLLSEAIKTALGGESEQALQADDSYSYEIEMSQFERCRVQSPTVFLVTALKQSMEVAKEEGFVIDGNEIGALWTLYAAGSCLSAISKGRQENEE